MSDFENTRAQNILKHMYMYGLRVGHTLPGPWEAELDFMYSPTKAAAVKLFTYHASFNALYNIPVGKRIVGYLLAGPGVLSLNLDQVQSSSKLAISAGAGLKIFLIERFAFRPEFRTLTTFDPLNVGILGTLMLTYYADYSRKKKILDTDGDGIFDPSDQCPSEKETINQHMDSDGCPDAPPETQAPVALDTDQDGIPDESDACKEEKETVNNYMDEDGCPDAPPVIPPAFTAPDKDSDGDGILDKFDQCVNDPETLNSYMDEDGCPDAVPQELKKFTGRMEGINFALNSAIIEKKSYGILDETVAVLKKFPQLTVKIEGHTDSTGSLKLNLRLSKERAESVRQYLTSQGIEASRLTIEGLGPKKPIASNTTSTGRGQNRRIEFKVNERAR